MNWYFFAAMSLKTMGTTKLRASVANANNSARMTRNFLLKSFFGQKNGKKWDMICRLVNNNGLDNCSLIHLSIGKHNYARCYLYSSMSDSTVLNDFN